jgi:hypothetical protein
MTSTLDADTTTTTCHHCRKVMATPATLLRHLTRMHADVVAIPAPRARVEPLLGWPDAGQRSAAPAAPVQASVFGTPPPPPPPVSSKPLWKKKRVFIPAGLVALMVLGGMLNPSDGTTPTSAPALTAAQQADATAKTAADRAAATKEAADKSAADKAAATKAAAEKAAADKAAAAKAAADKAAAAKAAAAKAAADKAAAAKVAAEKAAAAKAAAMTAGQRNASRAAGDYLSMTAFSRSGLIDQLKYEGYSATDATYGVDSLNANWNTQAAKAAKGYLEMTAFSRSGLIDQLMYEGYSRSQASYGVTQAGL